MEVKMNKLKLTVALLAIVLLFGLTKTPSLAAGAMQNPVTPMTVEQSAGGLVLAGYQHNGQYCQYRECAEYYSCGYYKKCCRYYTYSGCGPYSGGGGYKKRYYGGGGGGY
jgi:hypothetical protein